MTYLIDISGHQTGLDIALVREAGNEAVIVKAVAAYKPEHTVADGYQAHIDRVIAAGLPKGHYAVPNSQNTPKQLAAFFAANLYRRAPGDVFMLDNEPLDTYKTFWRDDAVMEFFEEFVRLTGVPWSQLWLYCPASLTRSSGPWTRVEAARSKGLKIVWVSYGDMDPYREDGEEPLLGGGITGWDVHQFTSTYRVAGYGGNLDRNYSPHPISYLFGGGTVSLESKARAYAEKYQTPDTGEASWDQMCGNLMFRFGKYSSPGWAPSITGPNAWNVGLASGVRNLDASKAPTGAIHWWRNRGGTGMPGHVGVDLTGGGGNVFMATWAVRESLGEAIGIQSVSGYSNAKTFMEYMGWTTNYAGAKFSTSSTAGLGYDLIEEEQKQGDIMARYIWAPGRAGVLVKLEEGGLYYPATIEEAEGLSVATNGIDISDRQWDVLRQTALNIQAARGGELNSLTAKIDAAFAEIAKLVEESDADVDEAKLAAALGPILKAQGIEAKVDAEKLADVFLNAQAKRLGE